MDHDCNIDRGKVLLPALPIVPRCFVERRSQGDNSRSRWRLIMKCCLVPLTTFSDYSKYEILNRGRCREGRTPSTLEIDSNSSAPLMRGGVLRRGSLTPDESRHRDSNLRARGDVFHDASRGKCHRCHTVTTPSAWDYCTDPAAPRGSDNISMAVCVICLKFPTRRFFGFKMGSRRRSRHAQFQCSCVRH